MKLDNLHFNGDKVDFQDRPEHEKKLFALIGAVNGEYKTDYFGMEKALSVRLNVLTYPKVKALSTLSDNSMNVIINDLIEVACGIMLDNMSDEDGNKFLKLQSQIVKDWIQQHDEKGSK